MINLDEPPIYFDFTDAQHGMSEEYMNWLTQQVSRLNNFIVSGSTNASSTNFVIEYDDPSTNDIPMVVTKAVGSNNESIQTVSIKTSGSPTGIEVTMTGSPGSGHELYYQVMRERT